MVDESQSLTPRTPHNNNKHHCQTNKYVFVVWVYICIGCTGSVNVSCAIVQRSRVLVIIIISFRLSNHSGICQSLRRRDIIDDNRRSCHVFMAVQCELC